MQTDDEHDVSLEKKGTFVFFGHTLVVGHRGASGWAPENTEDAFRLAGHHRAHAVETDIRRTRDGTLVLIHDETVNRTTDGKGRVGDLELEEIRRLDAGSWFGGAFSDQRILTLDEGLRLFRSLDLGAVLEIKELDTCEEVAGKVREHGWVEKTHIVSFLPETFERVKRAEPGLTGTLILDPRRGGIGGADPVRHLAGMARTCGADGIALFLEVAAKEIVRGLGELGLAVTVLLPNEMDEIRRAAGLGANAILSNFPDRVTAVLAESEDAGTKGAAAE